MKYQQCLYVIWIMIDHIRVAGDKSFIGGKIMADEKEEDRFKKAQKPRKRTQYNEFQGHCIWDTMQRKNHEVSAPEAMSACAYAWRNKGEPSTTTIELVDEYLKGEERFE